ncbi:hypothetical protein HK096_009003 [Nowakowskiella sp. JEL0078]|nr:hypothetical protein HK096_009003 [Nowakowskiella sp. JEL0078]
MGYDTSLEVPLIKIDKSYPESFELFYPIDLIFENESVSVLSVAQSGVSVSISTIDPQAPSASFNSITNNIETRSALNSNLEILTKKSKNKQNLFYSFKNFSKSLFSNNSSKSTDFISNLSNSDGLSEMTVQRTPALPNLSQGMELLGSITVPKAPQNQEENKQNIIKNFKIPENSLDNIQSHSSLNSGSAPLQTKSNTPSLLIELHLTDLLEFKDMPDHVTYLNHSNLENIFNREENSNSSQSPDPAKLKPSKPQFSVTNFKERPESPLNTKSVLTPINKQHLQSASFSSLPRPSTPHLHAAKVNISPRHSISDVSDLSESSRRPRSANAILKQLKKMESQGVTPLTYTDLTSSSSLKKYAISRSLFTFVQQGSSDEENDDLLDTADDMQPLDDMIQVSSKRRQHVRFAEVVQTFTWIVSSDEESNDNTDELDIDENDSDPDDTKYYFRPMRRGRSVLSDNYQRQRDHSPVPGMWVTKYKERKKEQVWIRCDLSPGPRQRVSITKRDSFSRIGERSRKRCIEFEGSVKILDQGPRWRG